MWAFLIGAAVLFACLLAFRGFTTADPKRLARALRQGGAILLLGLAALLLIRGFFWLALPVGAFALALLGWRMPGMGQWQTVGSPGATGANPTSAVETGWLRMTLDQGTGEMDGVVLQGPMRGARLDELEPGELQALLAELRVADGNSATLLEAYLDRRFGAGAWRRAGQAPPPPPGGPMSAEVARSVLGVGASATADEIKAAHRRRMKESHPDQGGDPEEAARINLARDYLLDLMEKNGR